MQLADNKHLHHQMVIHKTITTTETGTLCWQTRKRKGVR